MKKSTIVALSFCLTVAAPSMVFPQNAPLAGDLQVSADTLGAIVLGQKIQLMMRDGTYVEGKVLRVSQNDIFMHVSKVDPKDRAPKGLLPGAESALRTAEIAVVHLKKNGSIAAPVALGVVGGFLGAIGAAYAADRVHSAPAYFTIFLASAAGGATGGALLGHKAATRIITISVTPSGR